MEQVSADGVLGASAREVWELVSDFDGFLKVLAERFGTPVEGEGAGVGVLHKATTRIDVFRQLIGEEFADALGDPGPVVQRIDEVDNANMRLVYTMLETGPMPLTKWSAAIHLVEVAKSRSRVTWTATFEPAGVGQEVASAILRNLLRVGVETLQARYGS
jgi:hypothetical protein